MFHFWHALRTKRLTTFGEIMHTIIHIHVAEQMVWSGSFEIVCCTMHNSIKSFAKSF